MNGRPNLNSLRKVWVVQNERGELLGVYDDERQAGERARLTRARRLCVAYLDSIGCVWSRHEGRDNRDRPVYTPWLHIDRLGDYGDQRQVQPGQFV